jgi:N-acetylglucosaminylphosphatidylinositol deacetylase
LLVTAHPDDESMFFGPTLVSLCKKRSVSLLCLSTGDYEKKGHLRKQELYEAAECFGIEQDHITIIRSEHFIVTCLCSGRNHPSA